MSKKEEKSKEYAESIYNTEIWQDEAEKCFESGWHAAMEYIYRLPLDTMVEEVIKEMKGE